MKKLVAEKTADPVQKNRDLEIEAALERVRARTMAMQRSEELQDATLLFFNRLDSQRKNTQCNSPPRRASVKPLCNSLEPKMNYSEILQDNP